MPWVEKGHFANGNRNFVDSRRPFVDEMKFLLRVIGGGARFNNQ